MRFEEGDLKTLWKPSDNSNGEDNGQITIVGGSSLFTGAPLLSLVAASRLVDMVFLSTPEEDKTIANKVKVFSKLKSVIWISREDLDQYIEKSEAILIGPGLMRYHKSLPGEVLDEAGTETKMVTRYLLHKFSHKKWVIDGGSLQTMEPGWIPKGAIVTPNKKEFGLLFGDLGVEEAALKYNCIVVGKGPITVVSDGKTTYEVSGGNAGLTKGGTGDTLAGVIVGLVAKNEALISAAAGAYLVKKTAEQLFERVGYNFNADDVAGNVFGVFKALGY